MSLVRTTRYLMSETSLPHSVIYSKCISITSTERSLESGFLGSHRCLADGTTRVASDLQSSVPYIEWKKTKKNLTNVKVIVKCWAIRSDQVQTLDQVSIASSINFNSSSWLYLRQQRYRRKYFFDYNKFSDHNKNLEEIWDWIIIIIIYFIRNRHCHDKYKNC